MLMRFYRLYLLHQRYQEYQRSKVESLRAHQAVQKRGFFLNSFKPISNLKRLLGGLITGKLDRKRRKNTFFGRICARRTFENRFLRNALFLLIGIGISWGFFFFFIADNKLSRNKKSVLGGCFMICATIGAILTKRIRSYLILFIPTFLASRVKGFLVMMIISNLSIGPVTNIMTNITEMNRALMCCKIVVHQSMVAFVDQIKKPFKPVLDMVRKVVNAVRHFAQFIVSAFKKIYDIMRSLTDIIKKIFQYIRELPVRCNNQLGEPSRKCYSAVESVFNSCREKFWSFVCKPFQWIVEGTFCRILSAPKVFCRLIAIIIDIVEATILTPMSNLMKKFVKQFEVDVNIEHGKIHNETVNSTYADIMHSITEEFTERYYNLIAFLMSLQDISMLFALLIIYKSHRYHEKYLSRIHYDNRYIDRNLRIIEQQRLSRQMETIFPLSLNCRRAYVKTYSLQMPMKELVNIYHQLHAYGMTCLLVLIVVVTDVVIADMMRLVVNLLKPFLVKTDLPTTELTVRGNSSVTKLFKDIDDSIKSVKMNDSMVEIKDCLPQAEDTDVNILYKIFTLMFTTFLAIILKPYAFRMRHVVCDRFYPVRARERGVWLYQQILARKGNTLQYMRRQLRVKMKSGQNVERHTILERLVAIYPLLRYVFKPLMKQRRFCIICGSIGEENGSLIDCQTKNCKGLYCVKCFQQLENECTACLQPIDYGDGSDQDVEYDSSDVEKFQVGDSYLTMKHSDHNKDIEYLRFSSGESGDDQQRRLKVEKITNVEHSSLAKMNRNVEKALEAERRDASSQDFLQFDDEMEEEFKENRRLVFALRHRKRKYERMIDMPVKKKKKRRK